MPAVAAANHSVERRQGGRQQFSTGRLPGLDTAGQRQHIAIAHLPQRVGSQRYFDAAGFPGRTLGLEPDGAKQKTAGK